MEYLYLYKFDQILDMADNATFVILTVLLVRWLMRGFPRKYVYALWLIVGIRLVCPVILYYGSTVSVLNLKQVITNTAYTVGQEVVGNVREAVGEKGNVTEGYDSEDGKTEQGSGGSSLQREQDPGMTGTDEGGTGANEEQTGSNSQNIELADTELAKERTEEAGTGEDEKDGTETAPMAETSTDTDVDVTEPSEGESDRPDVFDWLSIVWLLGMASLISWNIILTVKLRKKLEKAVWSQDDKYESVYVSIYESDAISSPFVLGVYSPRIYIPFRLSDQEREYILKHEQYHIYKCDHIVKIIAFLLTCVYWFHPLVWVSYFLMTRDMEMRCDEYVLSEMGEDVREAYSRSLLAFAANERRFSLGTLAFGETNAQKRIKHVLNYKKKGRWMGVLAILLFALVGTACLTDENLTESDFVYGEEEDPGPDNLEDGNNYAGKEKPIRIQVLDSGNQISVTEGELSEIHTSEEDEYAQIHNNMVHGDFIHPYQGGYYYDVEKGGDGPEGVLFYDDGQGHMTECKDFSTISHIFGNTFYYGEKYKDGEEYPLKCWENGETRDILTCQYDRWSWWDAYFAEDGIYYADGDEESKKTYICKADYEGEEQQQLYIFDVEVEQVCVYQDTLWFVFNKFGGGKKQLGKLDMAAGEVSIYQGIRPNGMGTNASKLSINHGYLYFNASGLKRLDIRNDTVEPIFSKNMAAINFTEDSILFCRGRKLYRVDQKGVKNIMTLRRGTYHGIDGIRVEDGKIYIKAYAGSFFEPIYEIDQQGEIIREIYGGQWVSKVLAAEKKSGKQDNKIRIAYKTPSTPDGQWEYVTPDKDEQKQMKVYIGHLSAYNGEWEQKELREELSKEKKLGIALYYKGEYWVLYTGGYLSRDYGDGKVVYSAKLNLLPQFVLQRN